MKEKAYYIYKTNHV